MSEAEMTVSRDNAGLKREVSEQAIQAVSNAEDIAAETARSAEQAVTRGPGEGNS